MYIANASQQIQAFCYSVPENKKVIEQPIGIGQQIRISANGGNLSPTDVQCILEQHRKYGLISVEEIPRTKNFSGLCYSLDKPISFARLTQLIHQNRDALVERGKLQRRGAAVAVNNALQEHILASGSQDVLRQVEIEIEERTSSQIVGSRRENEDLARELADSPAVAEGLRVTRDAPPPKGGRQRRV